VEEEKGGVFKESKIVQKPCRADSVKWILEERPLKEIRASSKGYEADAGSWGKAEG